MNILVVCHDYKKHKLLTLVLGPNREDYIYLNEDAIKSISKKTNKRVKKIAFIDTATSDENTNKFQYNNWEVISAENSDEKNKFDYLFKINCPGYDNAYYKSFQILKSKGKIVNFNFYKPDKNTNTNITSKTYPFIVTPRSLSHDARFGPYNYYLEIENFDKEDSEDIDIEFDLSLIPTMDEHGNIALPSSTNSEKSVRNSGQNKTKKGKSVRKGGQNKTKKGKKGRKSNRRR